MKNSKLPMILALAVSALVIGVLLFLHFRVPQQEPPAPASSASASQALPGGAPWGGGGEVVTRIG